MVIRYKTDFKKLQDELNLILEEVTKNVAENLLEDFQEHLNETIYSPPENEYERWKEKGGFYSGWEISQIDALSYELGFNPDNLISWRDDNINTKFPAHSDSDDNDTRSDLPWILDNADYNYSFSRVHGSLYQDGYWMEYLLDLREKIVSWFDSEFRHYGIKRG